MGLFEFFGERRNPGPIGDLEVHPPEEAHYLRAHGPCDSRRPPVDRLGSRPDAMDLVVQRARRRNVRVGAVPDRRLLRPSEARLFESRPARGRDRPSLPLFRRRQSHAHVPAGCALAGSLHLDDVRRGVEGGARRLIPSDHCRRRLPGRSGEIGRRARLKILWGLPPVWVRFPPPAPVRLRGTTSERHQVPYPTKV